MSIVSLPLLDSHSKNTGKIPLKQCKNVQENLSCSIPYFLRENLCTRMGEFLIKSTYIVIAICEKHVFHIVKSLSIFSWVPIVAHIILEVWKKQFFFQCSMESFFWRFDLSLLRRIGKRAIFELYSKIKMWGIVNLHCVRQSLQQTEWIHLARSGGIW